jgi:hypothetical protein
LGEFADAKLTVAHRSPTVRSNSDRIFGGIDRGQRNGKRHKAKGRPEGRPCLERVAAA